MKKLILGMVLATLLVLPSTGFATDFNDWIVSLSATTSANPTDVFYVLTDPSSTAVSKKITAGNLIDNTPYDATSWDGVTTKAPSKDAVRDKFESLTKDNSTVSHLIAKYADGTIGDVTIGVGVSYNSSTHTLTGTGVTVVYDAHANLSPSSANLLGPNLFTNLTQSGNSNVTWPTRTSGQGLYASMGTTAAFYFRVTAPAQCITINGNMGTLYTYVQYTTAVRGSSFYCIAVDDDTVTGSVRIDCFDGVGILTGG